MVSFKPYSNIWISVSVKIISNFCWIAFRQLWINVSICVWVYVFCADLRSLSPTDSQGKKHFEHADWVSQRFSRFYAGMMIITLCSLVLIPLSILLRAYLLGTFTDDMLKFPIEILWAALFWEKGTDTAKLEDKTRNTEENEKKREWTDKIFLTISQWLGKHSR